MEQKIYFNGEETTQDFIDNYIKENGGFMACKMAVEYNNGVIKYSTPIFNTYSELMQYIDNNYDKVEYILDYDDFAVVKINDEYWYFEQGENDCDTFCKVEIMAELTYDANNDIQIKDANILHTLFDCYCCGEQVNDNDIKYLWFKAVV